jgi:hypothetical protein
MAASARNSQFLFAHFSKVQTEELLKISDPAAIKSLLREHLRITGYEEKEPMILQFHFNNFKFCTEQDFTLEKISTLLSILNYVFTEAMANKLQ